jgi:hypothetical protein
MFPLATWQFKLSIPELQFTGPTIDTSGGNWNTATADDSSNSWDWIKSIVYVVISEFYRESLFKVDKSDESVVMVSVTDKLLGSTSTIYEC